METPEMTRKLKAAEPTMVEAPSLPGAWPSVETVSIILSKISGALEPRAISVRFAIVGFQTEIFFSTRCPSSLTTKTFLVLLVMTSMQLSRYEKILTP